jgi:nucleotide-binding universal stress UspA family protein
MSTHWSLLCAVDFSPASFGALHYALAIARRFRCDVTVLTVDDGLLADVGDARMGEGWSRAETERELRTFVADGQRGFAPVNVDYDVRIGKAAPRILEVARERAADLIVMSTHGRSGVSKFVFGATAERVLRETTVPVLLAPEDPGALSFDDLARRASPVLVPVDFGPATAHQIEVAGRLADTLHLRLMIAHVLEPVSELVLAGIDEGELLSERHRRACRGLQSIAVTGRLPLAPEMLIASGDPSEEIARWVRDKQAGLLIMALRSDTDGGPRMGSVTYRAIAMSRVLTLALPAPARGQKGTWR